VDDVVADTFVICLRRIDDVPTSPLPWLYAVARKTLANERRKRERRAALPTEGSYEPEPPRDPPLAAAFARRDGSPLCSKRRRRLRPNRKERFDDVRRDCAAPGREPGPGGRS
jgi:RNA polymerase sigma-70 factor (ECF subfamily)